jgi:hypothetical protein
MAATVEIAFKAALRFISGLSKNLADPTAE